MAMMTVRNLPEEVHRALRIRAAQNGRSAEAEVRMILQAAVFPDERKKIGCSLREIWENVGLTDEEAQIISSANGKDPAEPPRLQ